jgi:hypothetical protein
MVEDAKTHAVKSCQPEFGSSPQKAIVRLQQDRHSVLRQAGLDSPGLPSQSSQRRGGLKRGTLHHNRHRQKPDEGERDRNLAQKPEEHILQSNTE